MMNDAFVRMSGIIRWQPLLRILICILLPVFLLVPGAGSNFPGWLVQGLVSDMPRVLALVGLYMFPGLALLRLFWPAPLPLSVRLALAPGMSAVLPPLLLLLAQQVGLPWNRLTTWIFLVLCLLCVAAPRRNAKRDLHWPWAGLQFDAPLVPLAVISVAALLVRLYAVRDLPTGLWNDSYHHTLMTALLVNSAGIFSSWAPYAPLTTFTYHYGFHANAAFVHFAAGIDPIQALVITGQILNAATVPLIFALAVVLLRATPSLGLWAALIVGFVLPLPAYFVNWGRYTQLAGQVALVAVLLSWSALVDVRAVIAAASRHEQVLAFLRAAWRPVLLAGITTAGLMLTHYLVTVVAAMMVGCFLLLYVLDQRSWRTLGRVALLAVPALLLAVIVTIPWFLNVLEGNLARNASLYVNGATVQQAIARVELPPLTPLFFKWYTLLGMLAGLCIAAWRREWRMLMLGLWVVGQFFLIGPHLFGLPGAGAIDYLTSLGSLYLIQAPLLGLLIVSAAGWLFGLVNRYRSVAALPSIVEALALLAVAGLSAGWQARVVDTASFQQVAPADVAAMRWIREQTPADARFVVNGYPYYAGTMVIANDAGGWIPLLAGRSATLPAMTYGSEQGMPADLFFQVSGLWEILRDRPLSDSRPVAVDLTRPEALEVLRNAGVSYVYSGASPKPPGAAADRIDTEKLRNNPDFRLVYNHEGVEIFEIARAP